MKCYLIKLLHKRTIGEHKNENLGIRRPINRPTKIIGLPHNFYQKVSIL